MAGERMKDGGPAFPGMWPSEEPHHFGQLMLKPGMSLRDWFAGQALAALGRTSNNWPEDQRVAVRCYEVADAMLAEREK